MSSERPVEIRLGLGSCCVASGSRKVYDAVQRSIKAARRKVVLRQAGCVGMCHRVPLIEIIEPGSEGSAGGAGRPGRRTMYGNVTESVVPTILERHIDPGGPMYRLRRGWSRLTSDHAWEDPNDYRIDPTSGPGAQFLGPQVRIATEACGQMDPTDIEEYRSHRGYEALQRAVTSMTPEAVIDEVTRAGLRGRGGAGFPTGRKWELCRKAQGCSRPGSAESPGAGGGNIPGLKVAAKYVICNGDEGDPGAFMDRMLLEAYPHRILEGLAIAAYAVGADEAIFYIRQEYPLAVERVGLAIRQAEAAGCIGPNVFGTQFSLKVSIKQGSGAFVCGEETALIASVEGRRGMPRLRPPYPAESGLWGRPTNVNNVETYAAVPWILRHGAEKYAAIGTESSKGTKVFSLTGKIVHGGLIEVPMGTTIHQIVQEIGGGIKFERRFKAIQIGGPSGGCIPAELADTPIDYEDLARLGAIMGSGGLVVLDDGDCMVDIARYFLQFTQHESCGKCTFCRIGTKRMLEILNRIVNGHGRAEDLDELEALCGQVKSASLCGLGQTAPNPVLTTLKYFRPEYEAHIAGRCPAGRCTALVNYRVTDDCIGCTICAQVCPVDAIEPRPHAKHWIDMDKCTCCHLCVHACPADAIRVE